jgi:hypothetical protein
LTLENAAEILFLEYAGGYISLYSEEKKGRNPYKLQSHTYPNHANVT